MKSSKENYHSQSEEENKSEQVYRLVTVDEDQAEGYARIHFIKLLRYYWDKKRIVYGCAIGFLIVGIFFAFSSQSEYQANTSIIPEYEMQDKANEIIESYGLLFGLTGNVGEQPEPSGLLERYPYMINSVSFQLKVMYQPFYYSKIDSTITLYQYFTEFYQPSTLQTIYKYTLGLPAMLSSSAGNRTSFAAQPTMTKQDSSIQIIQLTSKEKQVIGQLQSRILATYQRRPGLVRIQTTMPKPKLAAKLAQIILQVLQEVATNYKTKKGKLYKQFIDQQLQQAKAKLTKARKALTTFKQAASQPLSKRMELQSRYNFALDYYNTLSQQFERIKLTIREQLPAFRILDDITIPRHRSSPNRKLIIIFSLLLGVFVALCWITISFFVATLKNQPLDK